MKCQPFSRNKKNYFSEKLRIIISDEMTISIFPQK